MIYRVPVDEQSFLLDTIADLAALASTSSYPDFDPELVRPILLAASEFAEGKYAPLSRTGDRVGAVWRDGAVEMPPGYASAYRGYVDGGWGALGFPAEAGGQGLPFVLASAVQEGLGTADL